MVLVLGLTALAGSGLAQTVRYTRIAVEGNQRVDDASVLRFADIAPGAALGSTELNEAFQGLMGSGLFETVELVPSGNMLIIRVQEWPTVNRISIEGNRRLDDDVLLPLVGSTPRRVFSPTQAEADANAMAALYEARGLLAVTIDPRIIRRSDNRVDLIFEIQEGRVVENQRVAFVGNRAYSDRRLRRVLETKQAGILRAFFRSDTFIAERIEFDRAALREFYLNRGYIDFRILDVSTELSRERNATFVTFQIREGQQFRLGRITASSELPGIDPREFLDAGRIREGVVYAPTIIENGVTRMEGLATQKGLDFIRFVPEVNRNERELTLDINFRIERGPRVFVERIDIEGNQTTLDRVVRRQFRTVEGDPYNPREVRDAEERIRRLRYFSEVDVTPRQGSSAEQVIIDVDLEETTTGSLGVGASYSSDSGVGFNLSFNERNFLGRGQILSFDLNTTSETGTSQVTFTEPALLGRDLSMRLSAFYRQTEQNNASFDTTNFGISGELGFPIGEFTRLSTRYTLEQEEISNLPAGGSPIIAADIGERTISSFGYTWSYDTRTGGLDPNAGVLLQFSQDLAGFGGDTEYLRTTALAVAQKRLRNEDYTLRASIEGGNLTMLDDSNSTVGDRFFLRSSQLRGFDFRGVGPRDLNATERDALGGNNYLAARFEFGFPIGFLEDVGISGGLFYDVGTVWGLDNTVGAGGNPVDDSFILRSAVGLALFWDTPLGPLTFNFTEDIQSETYDKPRSFDISLTARF